MCTAIDLQWGVALRILTVQIHLIAVLKEQLDAIVFCWCCPEMLPCAVVWPPFHPSNWGLRDDTGAVQQPKPTLTVNGSI